MDRSAHRISAQSGGKMDLCSKDSLSVTREHVFPMQTMNVVLRFCINQLVKDYQQNKSQHADCLPAARHYVAFVMIIEALVLHGRRPFYGFTEV